MCGRFSLILPPGELLRDQHIAISAVEPWQPRYNIAPSQQIVVLQQASAGPEAVAMRWGIPLRSLFHNLPAKLLINAKVETVHRNKVFRELLQRRRLVVPADSFYEWGVAAGRKIPYRILRADGEPLFMGGFGADVAEGPAAAVLTVAAAPSLARLHERMPLLLSSVGALRWLGTADPMALLRAEELPLRYYRVDSWVNGAGHEGPRCHAAAASIPDLFE